MIFKIKENNSTKMTSFDHYLNNLCIDGITRNLYTFYQDLEYWYILKFDLTMWENGIIKFDEIVKSKISITNLNVSPSIGYVYYRSPEKIIFH